MIICMKIIGLKKIKIKIIKNKKGDILKFVSKKSKFFKSFGEIYFTEINYRKVKGWNLHKRNKCLLTVCYGKAIFYFIDGRKKSRTFHKEKKIILEKRNHGIIIVPPGVWFSFTTNNKKTVIANFLNKPHSDSETQKINKVKKYKIK